MDPLRNITRLSELSGHLLRLPTTDRGTFATLTSVSDIQEWTRSKADEYRQFALALLALHNLAAPIHRLPTEVLERILEQCWQDWKSLRLPHVCRLWRSILLGRTAFWADAVADCELLEKRDVARDELPLIDALLSRSTQHAHTIKPSFYTFPRSIAESLTPYVGNVVSLQVAVGEGDLHERLWPLLLSGMPNLEALTIQLTITEEDLSRYDEREHGDLAYYHTKAWDKLPMLSRKTLPKLSRLTCPHSMIGRFGDVLLRHLKLECIDRSEHSLSHIPIIARTPRGLHLEPYRDCLETLEIMPTWLKDDDPHPPPPLELPCLRYLRIASDDKVASRIVSWLLLPQTALIHITGLSATEFRRSTKLLSIVRTIDRVCLQQVAECEKWAEYQMQCFKGDIERLRIDDFAVFRMASLSTELELSTSTSTPSRTWYTST
ncbi:hypothetical protein LXA43DRAFT_335198 [Ganoderma leucocontextum]|nr:hypothetical protein LXA43DRAFT_335198 [Ganoderma leucocontextum]